MNKIIQFSYEISEKEYILIELQGSISHSTEKNFHEMYFGKLEKKSEVKLLI